MINQGRYKFTVSYLAGYILWIAVHTFVLKYNGLPLRIALTDSIIFNSCIALFGYALSSTLRYYRPGIDKFHYLAGWTLVGTIFVLCLSWLFNWIVIGNETNYSQIIHQSLLVRAVFSFFVLGSIALISWVYFSKQEQSKIERKFLDAERLMREAELASLRQQMQPHFLFNSLNSINSLIGKEPAQARKMVIQLSDFLRGTLNKDLQQMIQLKEELEHLSLYLSIEKVRFGHRLHIHINCDDTLEGLTIPALILQPVLENAIKFGLYGTLEAIDITVTIHSLPEFTIIEISNPFDSDSSVMRGTGFGLNSIKRRLTLLYNRNDLLETEVVEQLFITRLKIPTINANLSNN